MTARGPKHLLAASVFVLAALALSGCIGPGADSTGRYAAPIGGSPVIANETPYSAALRCLERYTRAKPLRIAVGRIADYTGKAESDYGGRAVTQGAALMAMSALAKAGVPLVERFDTSVAEMERKYANDKLITGDHDDHGAGDDRRIMTGSIPGSDYYLVGGITELNFNIRSVGDTGDGGETATDGPKGTAGSDMFVMNVGLDLRLVDTDTLEVVDVISYQKQIIGRQIRAGVFDVLGHTFFGAANGESALEPIQLAVRSVIERAVLEMVSRAYRVPANACADIGAPGDPLAGPDDNPPALPAAARSHAATARETHNVESRQEPERDDGTVDPDARPRLRGPVD